MKVRKNKYMRILLQDVNIAIEKLKTLLKKVADKF